MSNLDRRCSPPSRSRISHQLRLNAPVHCAKQENSSINCFGSSQDSVISQDRSLFVSECGGNVLSFFRVKGYPSEIIVHRMVTVKAAVELTSTIIIIDLYIVQITGRRLD
jgi:hypothetical protein